jgi:hypothetical protein
MQKATPPAIAITQKKPRGGRLRYGVRVAAKNTRSDAVSSDGISTMHEV